VKGKDLLLELQRRKVVVLDADDLMELLESAETIREDDTSIAGPIRILRIDRLIVVQETTTEKREVVVRGFRSLEEAQSFVDQRLATYERMWDGCGCKIDYFS
jgi:hypothetical protein